MLVLFFSLAVDNFGRKTAGFLTNWLLWHVDSLLEPPDNCEHNTAVLLQLLCCYDTPAMWISPESVV